VSLQIIKRGLSIVVAGSLGFALFTLSAGVSGAASAKAPLPVKKIVTQSDEDINAIRTFFFCQTSKCKKVSTQNKAAALAGLGDLKSEVGTMQADAVPSSEAAIVAKYENDATALIKALNNYAKQKSADDVANNIGIIYYQSSNIGSDDYLIGCIATKTPVSFKAWSVGVVGVAYAMQVDTQAETSSASAATITSVNRSLLTEAASMRSDANGPNVTFNNMVVQFALNQTTDSRDSLLILANKAGSLTAADLKALATKLTAEFKAIAALQNKLAG
jgi:hypothetical protein